MNRPAVPLWMAQVLVFTAVLFFGSPAMSIEEPAYELRHTAGKIEYREYAGHLIAETLVEGRTDFESAGSRNLPVTTRRLCRLSCAVTR